MKLKEVYQLEDKLSAAVEPQSTPQRMTSGQANSQVVGKPASTASGGGQPARKPLKDVTHLYYPSSQKKNAGHKIHGLRGMR